MYPSENHDKKMGGNMDIDISYVCKYVLCWSQGIKSVG